MLYISALPHCSRLIQLKEKIAWDDTFAPLKPSRIEIEDKKHFCVWSPHWKKWLQLTVIFRFFLEEGDEGCEMFAHPKVRTKEGNYSVLLTISHNFWYVNVVIQLQFCNLTTQGPRIRIYREFEKRRLFSPDSGPIQRQSNGSPWYK